MTNTIVGGRQTAAIALDMDMNMTGIGTAVNGRVRTGTRSRRASRNMLITAFALIAAVFLLVGLSAYAASIQHANNVLSEQNAYLQAEIDSLNSQIIEATKVTKLEEIATNEYGMVYPTSANCIIIDESEDCSTKLASAIRKEAYN